MWHWTVHLDGGPRRVNHAAVAIGNSIYSFGGYCSDEDYEVRRPLDVHVLNTDTYRWRSLSLPSENDPQYFDTPYQRYGHTVVAFRGRAYLWGGRNDSEGASSRLHCFDPATGRWERLRVSGRVPPSRDGHSACVLGDEMVVFGGFEEEFQRFSQETFALNLNTLEWREVRAKGVAPPWRDFHTATPIGNRMYIFGGRSDQLGQFHSNREVYYDKLKYLDLSDNTWYDPPSCGEAPSGRRSHSAWCHNGKLYIFGGYSGLKNQHFNSIYQYDPVSGLWSLITARGNGPKPRRRQCCVLANDKVFLFGGTAPLEAGQLAALAEVGVFAGLVPENIEMVLGASTFAERSLMDLADLYVLDMAPTLRTLSTLSLLKSGISEAHYRDIIPRELRFDLDCMTLPNRISCQPQRLETYHG